MKGMVLQGRRGAVITALDIVSPTSNYVESSGMRPPSKRSYICAAGALPASIQLDIVSPTSEVRAKNLMTRRDGPELRDSEVCSHRGPALWAQSPGGSIVLSRWASKHHLLQ